MRNKSKEFDPVNRPKHYNSHPSGVECIDIVEWFPANLANAWKYMHRRELKDQPAQDLDKAAWYIRREIARRGKLARQRVTVEFFCPPALEKKVARFLRFEAGVRRVIFSQLWEAANSPNSLDHLKNAQVVLSNIVSGKVNP